MAKLLGDSIQVGFGAETARGTPVAPAVWLPARAPSSIQPVLDKVLIRETRATRMGSQSSEIIHKRAEGAIEFNVRPNAIGYILKSLFGSVTPESLGAGVYRHTFAPLLNNPQHPTLTLALAQAPSGYQDYRFPFALVNQLELRTPVSDVVQATAQFIASGEEEQSNYEPADNADDLLFRNHEVRIRIAADVSGLGAASPLRVKEHTLTINNGGRADYAVSDLMPSDMVATLFNVTGNLTIDYEGKTYHDIFVAGEYRAMRIEMTRPEDIGGSESAQLVIDLPKVSFETLANNRPIDDVVADAINFTAHYDDDEATGIEARLINNTASY